MSKYIKPTIALSSTGTTIASASSCSSSTTDANLVREILESMGYDIEKAFGMYEGCPEPFVLEEYCKFSSSIQVFNS